MTAPPETLRNEWVFLTLVAAGGIALRLIWLVIVQGELTAFPSAGEAQRVALALAQGRGFADAYFDGQGPTAHLLPISPAIAGGVLWLFGPYSDAASLILLFWALLQTIGGYLLLMLLFRRLGMEAASLRWGFALLCLVPPFVVQEVVDFRYWESGLAVLLGTAALLLVTGIDRDRAADNRMLAGTGALIALLSFIAPSAGLAAGLCAGLMLLLRRPSWRGVLSLAGSFALCLAAMVTPWALRNAEALGAPVLLRSNAGLELAIANHDDALSARPPEQVFADRLTAIHPAAAGPALRAGLRERGGEVRYAQRLGEETRRWIGAHPADFARLCLRHLRQYLLPEPWQFYFSGWEGARTARALTIAIVSALGLIGLATRLLGRSRGYWPIALTIATIALTYAPFQPMARYIYLTYGLLAFLAVDLLVRARSAAIRWST